MDKLNALYAQLLGFGFTSLRDAVDSEDYEWAKAEIEFLHNVPSLIGEANVERHRYFWFTERPHFLDWANQAGGSEPRSRIKRYYELVWNEMEPILLEWFGSPRA